MNSPLSLVREHGWNATSFQTLRAGYQYHFHAGGCVAYVDTGGAWVAAGAPFCRSDELRTLALDFTRAAERAGRRAQFFGVESRFLAATAGEFEQLNIGEQPVWDPRAWPEILAAHPSLREQLRRARAKGVRVRALERHELESKPLVDSLRRLVARWQERRALPNMGFLVSVDPLQLPEHRRCLIAERGDSIVGVVCLLPVPGRDGWFVEHIVRDPDAPNGTADLLVDSAMRFAASVGSPWLTLGLAPLSGDVARPLDWASRSLSFLYDFSGLCSFKSKFRPREWMPLYLAHPRGTSSTRAVADTLTAFSDGGLVRFGFRALFG